MYKLYVLCLAVMISFSVLANTEKLRDPTMPLRYAAVGNSQTPTAIALQLHSILISQQRRLAVINGQSLRQGDDIKGTGFRVIAIQANSVTVQSNQATRVLSLVDTKVKK